MTTTTKVAHVKYDKPRETHRSGLTVYEIPGEGLYRVIRANTNDFEVGTLTQAGWITLIKFDERDNLTDARAALELWLEIQTAVAQSIPEPS